MDKVFNVEIDGQITLPDGRKLGPFEETTVNVVQPSEGGSDPIVENAKQTGGFGYTEQGDETTITWDGDTEGRDIISISVRGMTINYCKVAEKGTGYTDTAKYTESEGDHIADLLNGDGAISYVTDFPVVIIADGGEFNFDGLFGGTAPSSGVYFVYLDGNDNASSLTYGTPDTVHKIDEKYLPSSGGGVVVTFSASPDSLTASHTVEEVSTAMQHGAVFAIVEMVYQGTTTFVTSGFMRWLQADEREEPNFDDNSPVLNVATYLDDFGWKEYPLIYVANGEWQLGG